ncbi:uncharacterized protein PFL1_01906 [Pseudozyma flocculosa PF-1]|uniref:Metallo-beta-lactamase domain-containing protein n=1 Tax=Pseudozyma flocculosa TaxID=84751 RepID=A0A5C3EYU5_9BASI|nr:uncharacterized protein PFL1_01906 [Pseudozyma flocculosa PF-1]EPQ30380.1 hypothetical protein PFL1_01906 [Pseudozyma flocculosa PF-1]SPO37453.1 uncharacterized protein PSFLO_02927 [Pseudozyma flocculosa]
MAARRRPLGAASPSSSATLQRLNGDTSWLLSIPFPPRSRNQTPDSHNDDDDDDDQEERPRRYHILIDPWLAPTAQTDGLALFSRQTRVVPSCFPSIRALASHLRALDPRHRIDAVLFSHPFTDHTHPETVLDARDVLADVHRISTPYSVHGVRSLLALPASSKAKGSDLVLSPTGAPLTLPDSPGVQVSYLAAKEGLSPAWKKLHGAVHISFPCPATPPPSSIGATPTTHQILYTPHGLAPTSLPPSLHASPSSSTGGQRILLHSFDRQSLPLVGVVSSGMPNIHALDHVWHPTAVLSTHDEDKRAEGLVARLIQRQRYSVQEVEDCLGAHVVVRSLGVGDVLEVPP